MSLLALIAVALGFAAGPPVVNSAEPPVACTEIGCESGLTAQLGGLRTAFPKAKRVKVCLEDRCRIVRRSRLDYVTIRGVNAESPATLKVRYVAYGKRGKVLGRSSIRGTVRRTQPNGEFCPPVCFQVNVWADQRGRLSGDPMPL